MKLTFDISIIKAMATATTPATPMEHTGLEKGLIKNLSKRNGQLYFEQQAHKKAKKNALDMIWKLSTDGTEGKKNIIEYLELCGYMEQAYLPTEIGEYENKKGVKSMAHFNENGKYIASVRAKGDKPFYVLTWTAVVEGKEDLWNIRTTAQGNVYLEPVKKEGIVEE